MAEQTIDKLQIEVEATTKSVSSVFSSITSQLKTLNSVASSIDVDKIVKAKNALESLNKSTGSSKSNTPKIDTTNITKAEKDIQKSVSSIKSKLDGLSAYSQAAKLGDSSSFTSFQRRVISIQSDIDVLKGKMESLGDTRVETEAFTKVKEDISDAEAKLTELQSKKDEYLSGSSTMTTSEFSQLESDIKTAENEMDALQQKQDDLVNSGSAYTDPFASYKDSLTEVEGQLGTVKTETEEAFNKNNVTLDLSKVTSSLQTVLSKLWQISSTTISSAISGLKSKFTGLGSSVSGTTDKISSAFKTIIKYGFGIRSMYVLFRRLRTAIKDSFTELQTSGAMYQTTKANIDALKTSLSTLKYQFGAAFEPIFNTIAPALTTLINYLVSVMNTISALIAKLTGNSTYSKAVVSTAAIASNTGSAASSAKELNKQLQGFDELNNLTTSDSSSGGSGSGSSDSTNVTYVEENVENALGSFSNSIINAIQNGDWEEVGSIISSKITGALNDINWDSVFSTLSSWGTNLANFLNGLITPELFSSVGTTIGNAIKSKLTFLNSFGETFEWDEFGNSIASGLESFIKTHPLVLAAETFNTYANGILETLVTAVQTLLDDGAIEQIGEDIKDALEKIDLGEDGITWKLGTLVSGLASSLYELVSDKEMWTDLGTKIGEGISSFFESMNEVNSKTGLTGWEALGKDLSDTISGILTAITTAIKKISWDDVGQAIADFIAGIDFGELTWDLAELAWAIIEAIADAIYGYFDNGDALTKIGGAIVGLIALAKLTGLDTTISTLLTNAGFSGFVSSAINTLAKVALAITIIGVTFSWAEKVYDEDSFWSRIGASAIAGGGIFLASKTLGFSTKLSLTITAIEMAWGVGIEIGKSVSQWVADEMAEDGVLDSDAVAEYKRNSENSGTLGINWWKDIAEGISTDNFTDAWSEMWEDWFTPLFSEIEGWFSEGGWAYEVWQGIKGVVSDIWGVVETIVSDIWDAVKYVAKSVWDFAGDFIIDIASGIWKLFKTILNAIWSALKSIGSWIYDALVWLGVLDDESDDVTGGSGNVPSDNEAYYTVRVKLETEGINYDADSRFTNGKNNYTPQNTYNYMNTTPDAMSTYNNPTYNTNNGDTNDLSGAGTHILGSYSGNSTNNNNYNTTNNDNDTITTNNTTHNHNNTTNNNTTNNYVTNNYNGGSGSNGSGSGSSGISGTYHLGGSSAWGNNGSSYSQSFDFAFKINGKQADQNLFSEYEKNIKSLTKSLGLDGNQTSTKKKIIYNVDARQTGVDSSSTTLTDAFDSLLNSMSDIPSNTSLNVNLGGDMNNASDITSWASRFSTLTNVWKDSSSTLSAKVGGDMTSINDTDDWKSKFKTLKDEWTGKTATFNSEYKNSDTKSSGYSAFNGLKDAWKGTTATFNSTYKNSSTSSTGYSNLQALKKNWTGRTAQFDGKYVNASTSAQGYKDFNSLWQNWYGRTATFTVGFNTDASGIKSLANTLLEKMETAINNAFATSDVMKNNKVVFKRYATGGVADKATLGIFGEAGTEAIIPLENNLGWLNKMSDMMIEGMENSTKLKYTASPSSLGFNQSNVYSAMASNDELVSEQNRLLEEQNDLLRQILDKPSGISSRDVFNAVQGESNSYYNRTGNSPFLF